MVSVSLVLIESLEDHVIWSIKKGPTQAKELINYVGWPAIIFRFWSLTEHDSYASKKLQIKQKTSSTRLMLLWKDYGWFLIRIVDLRFFVKFHRSRPAIIFNFWTLREHVSYASKKLLNKQKTSSTWWVFLWKDYRCFLIEVSIFWFFGPAIIFNFLTPREHVSYPSKKGPNQAKELINMVSATLEGLWMRIVDFRFFVKLHRSGPLIIFSFWSLTEDVSYASKKLLIKQKTSSTWWVLLWKDYGWFLMELSIFDFSSNFTGPDLQ